MPVIKSEIDPLSDDCTSSGKVGFLSLYNKRVYVIRESWVFKSL